MDDNDTAVNNQTITDEPIETKENDDATTTTSTTNANANAQKKKTKPDVKGFFYSTGHLIYQLVMIVIVGTGFRILLTKYGNEQAFFPGSDISKVPYSDDASPFANDPTISSVKKSGLASFFEKFFPMNKWSFPYKNYFSEHEELGIISNIVLWFSESLAYSNQLMRSGVDTVLKGLYDYKDSKLAFWLFGLLAYIGIAFSLLVGMVSGVIGTIKALGRVWVGWQLFLLMCLPLLIPALLYIGSIVAAGYAITTFQSLFALVISIVFFFIFPYSLPNAIPFAKETLSMQRMNVLRMFLLILVINAFRYLGNGFGFGGLGLLLLSLFNIL